MGHQLSRVGNPALIRGGSSGAWETEYLALGCPDKHSGLLQGGMRRVRGLELLLLAEGYWPDVRGEPKSKAHV